MIHDSRYFTSNRKFFFPQSTCATLIQTLSFLRAVVEQAALHNKLNTRKYSSVCM